MKEGMPRFISTALCAALLTDCVSDTGSVSSAVESAPGAGEGRKLSAYTSFYTMQGFVEKIGGDKVTVANLVPPGTEPHDWEPQSNDITGLENANVFTYNGVGTEHWADSMLDSLQNDKLVAVEASSGISLLEGASRYEDEEDPAGENTGEGESSTGPHIWPNPLDAEKEMENIRNTFVQADPANQETYEANYSRYATQVDKLDSQFHEVTGGLKSKDLIVTHQAFGYLCKKHGLDQVVIEGLSTDSKSDAARMAEIIEFTKEHKITAIFFEELVSPKVARTIAKATDTKAVMLDPVEGLSDENKAKGPDYFSIMEKSLEATRETNGG